jgi:hypothetical protein
MSGSISIPLGVLAIIIGGSSGLWFAVLAFVSLLIFAVGMKIKNHTSTEAHKKEIKAREEEHLKERGALEKAIKTLQTPLLEIEGIVSDIPNSRKHLCQIRILNKSDTLTADNVKVEVIEMQDGLENNVQEQYFRPPFPFGLEPQNGMTTINPGASQAYRLFHVMVHDGWSRVENSQEIIGYRRIIAYFTPGHAAQNLTRFLWKKDYRTKLIVTARDFSKKEQEFNHNFAHNGASCRFLLTKI